MHGMARLAWTDRFAFVNGSFEPLRGDPFREETIASMCRERGLRVRRQLSENEADWVMWLARCGAFGLPDST